MDRKSTGVLVFVASLVLVACGGGGSATTAGIDGTGAPGAQDMLAVGTVTGFGSVIVNGVRYDTSSASFLIDGSAGSQDDLAVGDVVAIRGSLDSDDPTSGTATQVVFDDLVEGPIEAGSIDVPLGVFIVLGQTVNVSADTSFDDSIQPPGLEGLSDGDIVEVSGYRESDGSIQATRIELKAPGEAFEVTGTVANLDDVAFTFDISGLSVDYATAMIEDFAGGAIQEGDLVEARGDTLGAGGELIATRVEFKGNDFAGEDGDRAEIEGFITRFANLSDFDVSGLPVMTTAQTVYEGGASGDLGLDVKVEVEGEFNAAGVLVAREVEIRRAQAVRVAAVIDSVDTATDSFVVLGITVSTDALTRIEDKSDAEVSPFSVDDLMSGDFVEVRGSELPAGSGEILAGLVERKDTGGETELQGFVTADNGSELTILGVTISTSAGTVYRDENEAPISSAEFFDRVGVGSLVEAKGAEIASLVISADELEIETE